MLFCTVRTLTHSSNCDILQLMDRLKAALQINQIFTDNPEFSHKDRLALKTKTNDYSSVRDWVGDLNCIEISLLACWRLGKKRALTSIQMTQMIHYRLQLMNIQLC